MTLPAVLGLLVFFLAPLAAFVLYSFLTAGLFSVSGPLTLDAYRQAVSSGVNGTLAMNSFVVGIFAASVTLVVSLPIAYWLRYAAGRWQTLVLFLITATLFASYLVRIYAWRSILGENGLLNSGLRAARLDRRAAQLPALQPLLGHGRARPHLSALRRARPLRRPSAAHARRSSSPPRIWARTR